MPWSYLNQKMTKDCCGVCSNYPMRTWRNNDLPATLCWLKSIFGIHFSHRLQILVSVTLARFIFGSIESWMPKAFPVLACWRNLTTEILLLSRFPLEKAVFLFLLRVGNPKKANSPCPRNSCHFFIRCSKSAERPHHLLLNSL